MIELKVTQYMRPTGRPKEKILEVPDTWKPLIEKIHSCSCTITCEQLQTLEAAQYITYIGEDADEVDNPDYDTEVTPSGSAADKALFSLLSRFDVDKFNEWLEKE